MKRTYEPPTAEKIAFCYEEQVAASTSQCISTWINMGLSSCESGTPTFWERKNV